MKDWVGETLRSVGRRRAAWRRGRNFGAAAGWRLAAPSPVQWIAAAGCIAALGGAVVIASHARQLSLSASVQRSAADLFQPVMPGAVFTVPPDAGITLQASPAGTFLISSGMRAAPAVVVDLCRQAEGRRLLPIRAGYYFADVARWTARNQLRPGSVSLRHVALAAPDVTVIASPRNSGRSSSRPISAKRARRWLPSGFLVSLPPLSALESLRPSASALRL